MLYCCEYSRVVNDSATVFFLQIYFAKSKNLTNPFKPVQMGSGRVFFLPRKGVENPVTLSL